MISSVPQLENQRRPSCHRGDSTYASPPSSRVVSFVDMGMLLSNRTMIPLNFSDLPLAQSRRVC